MALSSAILPGRDRTSRLWTAGGAELPSRSSAFASLIAKEELLAAVALPDFTSSESHHEELDGKDGEEGKRNAGVGKGKKAWSAAIQA